ncbi:hypothetical protein JKF63_05491 [Porcisia hertigi]|uniref:Uncharacterized protein n=1 Tax=Porcisia hertigi TaxID=2761500 RepID=A0A836LGL7_9TRYP|nr:hypothetical protein JKF63_05491 [Porcisia hertigi]
MRGCGPTHILLRRLRGMPRRRWCHRWQPIVLAFFVLFLCLGALRLMYSPTPPEVYSMPTKLWITSDMDPELFSYIVRGRTPGTAWREPSSNAIVSLSKSGTVVHPTPPKYLRHRRGTDGGPGTFRKWNSIYQPSEKYRIPAWATPEDTSTLRHASIFTSLAAFRDHECASTLRNLFEMAVAPHRLYVGISEERESSDTSCLASMGLANLESGDTRRVLYGAEAPAGFGVEVRNLSWDDVIQRRTLLDVDAELTVPLGGDRQTGESPRGVFVHPEHALERLLCIAGELETLRDTLLLAEDDAQRAATGRSVFRSGRGGPQQQPSRSLAGCRVTTRVAGVTFARGPTFGRYITSLFYFDQDYFMVVDSHTRFSVDWDMKLITRVFQLPSRGVLSYYPNGYSEGDENAEFDKKDFMLMCTAQILANGMPKLGAHWMPVAPHPVPQGFAAAGFMFGDAQFMLDVPFDPFLPYLFDGEEVLYSARLWTSGWDLYGPGQSVVFHNYYRPKTPKYFGIMEQKEDLRRVLSEQRALYMLRRAQPWVEELVRRGYMSTDGQSTLKPLPPVEAPETRLIVTDAAASAKREISVWATYYGMGAERSLSDYWQFTELTDEFVKTRDNEQRWMGGAGLCEKALTSAHP